ncbi:hypothetical protein NE236_27305 [Actinoallomurus purpureus]|uniref:hypothetical protein n=1 Tax=Actinoallomurus purpureus TaxID=478114 RepID=UPI002093AB8C|nr:hypothetical protein [Actinoallomurus purpureus]MCO6008687.1 hypothetical protein [Actinoallomurus purpureus]
MEARQVVRWTEAGTEHSARWRSENGAPPPRCVEVADDRMTADDAYHLACEGTAVLWRGAEHLGLRSRAELFAAFDAAGLETIAWSDVRPRHPRATDPADPLHAARAAEVTSLWRLRVRRV